MDEIKGIRIVSLTGEKEYGIEDSEVREELANVVDGAPEELDSFKEAFEKFKEGGEALAGIADDVAAVGKAVTDEAGRAKEAEKELANAITEESKVTDEKIANEQARAEMVEQTLANDIAKAPNLALRALFVAAGAEYNDTDQIIQKTAPWETEEKWVKNDDGTYTYWEEPAIVDHLPKHYYLNGLGDITEEEMTTIYIETFQTTKQKEWINSFRSQKLRTNLFPQFFYSAQIVKKIDAALYGTDIDVVRTCFTDNIDTSLETGFLLNYCSVKYIYGVWNVSNFSAMIGYATKNPNLRHVKIKGLKHSTVIFNEATHIYKRSILYSIQNAAPTTDITITLHPDAYARIANQPDILEALEAQPLVTLVSA